MVHGGVKEQDVVYANDFPGAVLASASAKRSAKI
jgi:hypothetical protein